MAKQTIITCDVTGKEGAEMITLPIYKRIPNPAGQADYDLKKVDVDLSPSAQKALLIHLMPYLVERESRDCILSFFRKHATPELVQRMTERLEEL